MKDEVEKLRPQKDYSEDTRSYKEFNKHVTGVFAGFEIAAQDYVYNQGKVSDKTLNKRLDTARREAFTEIEALIQKAQVEAVRAELEIIKEIPGKELYITDRLASLTKEDGETK